MYVIGAEYEWLWNFCSKVIYQGEGEGERERLSNIGNIVLLLVVSFRIPLSVFFFSHDTIQERMCEYGIGLYPWGSLQLPYLNWQEVATQARSSLSLVSFSF